MLDISERSIRRWETGEAMKLDTVGLVDGLLRRHDELVETMVALAWSGTVPTGGFVNDDHRSGGELSFHAPPGAVKLIWGDVLPDWCGGLPLGFVFTAAAKARARARGIRII